MFCIFHLWEHTQFGIKIFEIDFVIEIKWYLTFWPLPRAPGGGAQKKIAVARTIHVSNSHTKFGLISSNGFGGESITEGRTQARVPYYKLTRAFSSGELKIVPLNMPFMWVTYKPNLVEFGKIKFLTPPPPPRHDPGDRMKILSDTLYIFHLWEATRSLV